MKEFTSKIRAKTSEIFSATLTPVLALAGAGLISYGAYLIYHPAAYLVGGVILIIAAIDASS